MTVRKVYAPAVVLIAVIGATGCQAQGASGLDPADTTALRAALTAYLDAANTGDATQWAALYADDAVMMPPNSPAVEGRQAIEAWIAMLPAITDATGGASEVDGAGDLAYVRGTYSMNMLIPGVPEAIPLRGKLLQIYARQPDGAWRLTRDIWNADDAPPGP
jgi:uncharacterized protein (TIGR02246 family)